MDQPLSRSSRIELLEVLRTRYQTAAKREKSKILDQFVALAHCHRKHAIRLLKQTDIPLDKPQTQDRRIYDEAVQQALIALWEAADRICGKRLKAILPNLIEAMENHGHLQLEPLVRTRLLSASAATIDRLLTPVRERAQQRKKRKKKTKPSTQIPVRTFADWNQPAPGYLEIDFVVHCGDSMHGNYLHSLVATDVCTGWTEAACLLAREQSLVVEALRVIRAQFPVPILGIDSDNDSTFINDTLVNYCQQQKIEFTRSRAYQKNDQAWIEQKNGAVIRRFVGYDRFSGVVAGQILAGLYQALRLYVNYFQPSFKLLSKTRDGAKVKKIYDLPKTPCERLLEHANVAEDIRELLFCQRQELDPLNLLHRIRDSQQALASLNHSGRTNPGQCSLEEFLAGLPELWKEGEVRPTHRSAEPKERDWRTREDPFAAVWPKVLLWLEANPESTAKSLFERLQQEHQGEFAEGQLRTLQRRIREWRKVMSKQLIYGFGKEAPGEVEPIAPRKGEPEIN